MVCGSSMDLVTGVRIAGILAKPNNSTGRLDATPDAPTVSLKVAVRLRAGCCFIPAGRGGGRGGVLCRHPPAP